MIIYGKYSIPFRKFTPKQAGLEQYFSDDISIHAVQNCGHLFMIPVFGMGKEYYYKKDGTRFILPHDYEVQLLENINIRTPMFAYALPVMLLLAIGYLFSSSMLDQSGRSKSAKRLFNSTLEEIDYSLAHLGDQHYIKLRNPTEYSEPDLYLKVIKTGAKDIECKIMQTNEYDLDERPYAIEARYKRLEENLPTIRISKTDLESAICRNFSRYKKKLRPGIDLLKNGTPYFVESITYLDGPKIQASSIMSTGPDDFQIHLKNIGHSATLTRIEPARDNITWTAPLPWNLPGGFSNENNLFLSGTTSRPNEVQDIILFLQDTLGKEHKFLVKGSQNYSYSHRVY